LNENPNPSGDRELKTSIRSLALSIAGGDAGAEPLSPSSGVSCWESEFGAAGGTRRVISALAPGPDRRAHLT
jgi:hypothetical protein